MMNFSKLKTAAGALSIAAVLGVTGLAASPAQAQSFSFGINGGNGQPSFSFGIGDDDRRVGRHCLSDRQLRNELRSQGYRDVRFGYERRDRVEARAERGDWVYRLVVNSCTGRILDRDRLHRA